MLYNVATILQEPNGTTRVYTVDEDIDIDGEQRHVVGRARLDRTPRGILVRATFGSVMATQCSRCLRPVTLPLEIAVAEEYVPTLDVTSGAVVETLEGEEEAYRISAHHELDLAEAVRESWVMAVPMAPLCREDCPGLCPSCGKDLDPGHACAEAPIDHRWSKLAKLGNAEGS